MHLLTNVLLAATCCVPMAAGEPALSMNVPDLAGTTGRLAAGPFAAAWRDPGVAAWRDAMARDAEGWAALHRQSEVLRFELRCSPWHAGLPMVEAGLAMLAPQAAAPRTTGIVRTLRAGAWMLASIGPVDPKLPGVVEPRLLPRPDLAMRLSLDGLSNLMPVETAALARRILARCQLGTVELETQVNPDGLVERGVSVGTKLPLKALDPAMLAGLPERPLALFAAGLDGAELAKLAGELFAEHDPLAELSEHTAAALASACDGTVVFALVPGASAPSWLLVLPRGPVFDAIIRARIASQAPDAAEAVFAATADQPVLISWPGQGALAVRRSTTRWVVGSSAETMVTMAGDEPAPFVLTRLCPAADATAQAVIYAEPSGLLPWFANQLPDVHTATAKAMIAAAPHLPPMNLVIHAGADGLLLDGGNALGLALPALALLPSAGAALADQYQLDARAEAMQRMTRMLERCRAFAVATSGHWPRDLDDLRSWSKDLPADIAAHPGRPDLQVPFCYVQPRVGSPGDQPVLVQDVSINQGAGSLVGFVSGMVRFIPGNLHWREAKRLSVLPDARVDGFDALSWATTPRTF